MQISLKNHAPNLVFNQFKETLLKRNITQNNSKFNPVKLVKYTL